LTKLKAVSRKRAVRKAVGKKVSREWRKRNTKRRRGIRKKGRETEGKKARLPRRKGNWGNVGGGGVKKKGQKRGGKVSAKRMIASKSGRKKEKLHKKKIRLGKGGWLWGWGETIGKCMGGEREEALVSREKRKPRKKELSY